MFLSKLQCLLFILFLALFFGACSRSESDSDLPAYVLNRNVMVELLTDVHIIEAALQKKHSSGLLALDLATIYYDTLFSKHNITRIQLDSSISYYSRRPDVFEEIYTIVITNLSKKENEIRIESEIKKEFDLNIETEIIPEDKFEKQPIPRIQKEKIV